MNLNRNAPRSGLYINFMAKVSPARISAFEILLKIEKEKAFSSALLPIYEEKLSPKDRALCHEITLGVLRKKLYLDKIIEKFTKKKIGKFDSQVATALRIGLYQLLFLDKIPAHAAINESVNLVRIAKKKSAGNLVNAVLRRATREKIEFPYPDEIEKISVEESHPRWLFEKWIEQFGFETAEKIAKANNEIPNLSFRLTVKTSEETKKYIESGEKFIESEFIRDAWKATGFDEKLFDLAEKGEIYFQDAASQIVAGIVNLKEDQSFLDVCAAPGSKTTFAAKKVSQENLPGKMLIAGDFYKHRVEFLRGNCLRQNIDFVKFIVYDAEKSLPFAEESFDVILVDAPCTGTGTIRHNPEIRYFLKAEDVAELSRKQLEILKNASKLLKKKGKLIYSTCSLETEENEAVVNKFLAENARFGKKTEDLPRQFLTENGFARTFPHSADMDGFFISVFEKI